MKYKFKTRCLYGEEAFQVDSTGCLSFPIYQSATFAHPGVGQSTGYDYSRAQNPTREHVEKVVASLEEGYGGIGFTSGMAAIGAVMELFEPGDHVIASADLYGGTVRLLDNWAGRNRLEVEYLNTSVLDGIKERICPNTKAFYIETPSNPLMNVTDLRKVASLAKEHGCLLIVDNTFLSPYFQKPILLGADIVVHSGTKFLGGHNDTLAGFAVVATEELDQKIRYIQMTSGGVLAPFDSWLIARGIKTLSLRMEQQQKNAYLLADFLQKQEKVTEVFFVGLENHPGHEVNKSQASGAGSMISFRVDCEETAIHLLESVKTIHYAESLGGVETLITYPMLQTHADVKEEVRKALGITETLLRLSVGIEDVEDLIADLEQALSDRTS